MSERFPGGLIGKAPEITAPVRGVGGSAPGVWNLSQVESYRKRRLWPGRDRGRALYLWGNNLQGQLGDGTVANASSPVQLGASETWQQVSCGRQHTMAIKTDGTLWAWGNNAVGQLGVGTPGINQSSPVQIGALTDWAQVSAGGTHTMAIKTDGTLWAWGSNGDGRLGDGTTSDRSSPVQIGALTDWAKVSAGGLHTVAIKTDGTLWAWGSNGDGQLGASINFAINRSSPVQIGALTDWAQVSAGVEHTMAITTGGKLLAWGNNDRGQLGLNNATNRSSPTQVGALTNWQQVSGGRQHTVATKTDGTLWAWGFGNNGRVGDGTTITRSSPVQVGVLTSWFQASAGNLHTAAVTTYGVLWTWGENGDGQLGDGTTIDSSSPVQIGLAEDWRDVSAGGYHTAGRL